MIVGLHHVAVAVDDLAAGLAFYRFFGLREAQRAELPDGRLLVLLQGDGTAVELVWSNTTTRSIPLPLPDDLRRTGVKHVAFHSDDLDADLGRLAGLAFPPVVGPSHSPYGLRFAFLNDPAGNWVEIMGN